MIRHSFRNAKFVKTAVFPKDYPVIRDKSGNILPEIAVVGRSNVGKSSLLNHLFQNKNLVKVSGTPGKTQTINFFTSDEKLAFVDLPGYGYAKVSLEVRKQWAPMVEQYFENRETLELILILFDIRRIPTEEDQAMITWMYHYGKKILLVLTKVDKVTQSEKIANTKLILEALKMPNQAHIHYSVKSNVGRDHLISKIQEQLS